MARKIWQQTPATLPRNFIRTSAPGFRLPTEMCKYFGNPRKELVCLWGLDSEIMQRKQVPPRSINATLIICEHA